MGQEGTEGKNTSNFHSYKSFHFVGYFHTHPPGEPSHPSQADQKISKDLNIPVYTIGSKQLTKWYEGKEETIMYTLSLQAWCLENKSSWEKECCIPKRDKK